MQLKHTVTLLVALLIGQCLADVVPDSFDPRTDPSTQACVSPILDQGHCGACYAFAASSMFTDRLCLGLGFENSPMANKSVISPQPLLSCAGDSDGCQGGWVDLSWQYFANKGGPTCTGTGISACASGCYPYTSGIGCSDDRNNSGCAACQLRCNNNSPIMMQVFFASGFYFGRITPHDFLNKTAAMMYEIQANGPIATCFDLYEDFFSFYRKNPNGVYTKTKERVRSGRHCVRILGWGSGIEDVGNHTQQFVRYWIVANSWGDSWGTSGFFKYIRGSNLGDFEGGSVFAGCAQNAVRCAPTFPLGRRKNQSSNSKVAKEVHGGGWERHSGAAAQPEAANLAWSAVRSHPAASNSINAWKIIDYQTQVVAGINYRLTFESAPNRQVVVVSLHRNLADKLSITSVKLL